MKNVVCFVSGPLFCPSVDVEIGGKLIACKCPTNKSFRSERECAYLSLLNTAKYGKIGIVRENSDIIKAVEITLSIDDGIVEKLSKLK